MEDVWTALSLLIVVFTLDGAFRRGADTPNWDLRWRSLDAAGRARVAAAAKSSASEDAPTTPEELDERDLVAGYRRRQLRRASYFALATTPFIAAASVLALTGVIPHSVVGFVLAVSGIGTYLADRWMNRETRTVVDAASSAAQ